MNSPDGDKALLRLEVDPALKRATKVLAASNGTTMTALITDLLIERLQSPTPTANGPLHRSQ